MSLAPWIVYALAVGVILSAAAWCLDGALRRVGFPTRGVWTGAILLSLTLPAILGSVGQEAGAPGQSTSSVLAGSVEEEPPGGTTPASGWRAAVEVPVVLVGHAVGGMNRIVSVGANALPSDPLFGAAVLFVWVATTLVLVAWVLLGQLLLRRRMARFPIQPVLGRQVRVSEKLGPAVGGILRPAILLPRSVLAIPAEELELVLTHEEEHIRARDPLLLAAGLAAVILLPWNAPLWLQLKQLRASVEFDCDQRVLRSGIPPRRYGRVLLRVGAGATTPFVAVARLAPSRPLLTRRLKAMKTRSRYGSLPGSLITGMVGVALLTLACEAEAPLPPSSSEAPSPTTDGAPETAPQDASSRPPWEAPVFTPFDGTPELRNRPALQSAIEREYPPLLRNAGIGGRTIVWIYISDRGRIENALVREGSGHSELDEAALRVAREFEFTPATLGGTPVGVWVQVPVVFATP